MDNVLDILNEHKKGNKGEIIGVFESIIFGKVYWYVYDYSTARKKEGKISKLVNSLKGRR